MQLHLLIFLGSVLVCSCSIRIFGSYLCYAAAVLELCAAAFLDLYAAAVLELQELVSHKRFEEGNA